MRSDMSRWHNSSCSSPDITALKETPTCRTCNGSFSRELYTAQQASDSVLDKLPPNEPAGQLNLWWPPCVPYVNSSKDDESRILESEETATRHDRDQSAPPRPSPIYEKPLEPDEIRLACLSAPGHDNGPVHLTLETFKQDNCPEFEAVSYTWGGEDGDNARVWPVFVGPHWDVIMQTKNCWNMLQSIWPWRGVRMVWVDALCINQDHYMERGQQVAKMRQIFEDSTRVIVYLGPDIAPPMRDRFPHRRRLEELEQHVSSNSAQGDKFEEGEKMEVSFKQILERRYFSRLWVIQELVVSQRAVMRIGDTDFSIDSTTARNMHFAWNECAAPWLEHMSRGSTNVDDVDIYGLLAVTSMSRATDIRDRLFAIIGLINDEDQEEEEAYHWEPNYSLSTQHIFVGLLAHLIINLSKAELLLNASGISSSDSLPSWMPSWSTDEGWQANFSLPYFDRRDIRDLILRHLSTRSVSPTTQTDSLFKEDNYDLDVWRFDKLWKTFNLIPWHHDALVDSNCGTLSVYVTYLCAIQGEATRIQDLGDWKTFEIAGQNNTIILTSRSNLDTVINPESDHIFMLPHEFPFVYLILRKTEHNFGPMHYNLVGTCKSMAICIHPIIDLSGWKLCAANAFKEYPLEYGCKRYTFRSMKPFFPSAKTNSDMFPAYHALMAEYHGASETFEHIYSSFFDSRMEPMVLNGYLEWKFTNSSDGLRSYSNHLQVLLADEYKRNALEGLEISPGGGKWMWIVEFFVDMTPPGVSITEVLLSSFGQRIKFRANILKVKNYLRELFGPLELIQHHFEIDSYEAEALLNKFSASFHRDTIHPEMNEKLIDGHTFQVHIH